MNDHQPQLIKENIDKVEDYEFEPIKGYPMLHWKGKRPFRSTHFYPAQLKENHGEPVDNWMNQIYWGDNLQVMSHLLKKYRGQVKLIYIDPPFDSKADYKKKIALRGSTVESDLMAFEEKQYSDIWTNDEYLQFMYERLILLRELLAEDGSIYIHCDYRKSHYIFIIMDEIFGNNNLRNDLRWKRQPVRGAKATGNQYARNSDSIIFYSKSDNWIWNGSYKPYEENFIKTKFRPNENGRLFRDCDLGDYSEESIKEFERQGKIYITSGGKQRLIRYLDEEKGESLGDIWIDIPEVNSMAEEREGYPTQKPEALLERIIKASSNPGDIVFDCFMGSGTTQAVAMKLGRRFIGADINLGAIQTTTKRLINIAAELNNKEKKLVQEENEISTFYTGFSVYNVNHYDVFRNPVQAKELLIEALEIQPLPASTIYDGEKDGRLVKIMPVNRIATRADLNELITNFDYKTFEKRAGENPGKPVEKVLLVCMGHEPDLSAHLKKEVPFDLDIEVVDILRDRTDLQFKRDSAAEIKIEKGHLVIKKFYPMNLLNKLSIEKEKVKDWQELVESVMIDWNYDGSVLEPTLVDIPEKNELVKGKYKIPEGAGTIRVKITDLISESVEVTVE